VAADLGGRLDGGQVPGSFDAAAIEGLHERKGMILKCERGRDLASAVTRSVEHNHPAEGLQSVPLRPLMPPLVAQSEPRPYGTPCFKGPEYQEDGRSNTKEPKNQEGRQKNEAGKERPPIKLKSLCTDGHCIVKDQDAQDDCEDPDPQRVRRLETVGVKAAPAAKGKWISPSLR
jgi:hypothetical protein